MVTVPLSVPKAMVETGTLAADAAAAASSTGRPAVRYPSDSSTIRAGGRVDAPSAGTDWIALRQVYTASPVAVASASWSASIAWSTAVLSLPGETSTLAALENATSPML